MLASASILSKNCVYICTAVGLSHCNHRARGRCIFLNNPNALSHLISTHDKRWSENPQNDEYLARSTSSADVPNIPSIVFVPGARVGGGVR